MILTDRAELYPKQEGEVMLSPIPRSHDFVA